MDIRDYFLTDLTPRRPFLFETWQPRGPAVVVGYSQKTDREVHVARCRRDSVPIIRRRGGGGAVVLMPGIVCITCAFISAQSDSPYHFFRSINEWIIEQLWAHFQIPGLYSAGISDIALNNRKVLGCSMFKSRQSFLYQGSLLVSCEFHLFNSYLKHPSREPDYRRGRGHDEFMTTLWREGFRLEMDEILAALSSTRRISELSCRLRIG